ncbi:hypothetical protein HK102_000507, partial [Quaeritorhiza haematococci]
MQPTSAIKSAVVPRIHTHQQEQHISSINITTCLSTSKKKTIIFIANLPKEATPDILAKVFGQFAFIVGMHYIWLHQIWAVERMDGTITHKKTIAVKWAYNPPQQLIAISRREKTSDPSTMPFAIAADMSVASRRFPDPKNQEKPLGSKTANTTFDDS